jgi:hypothetical protein
VKIRPPLQEHQTVTTKAHHTHHSSARDLKRQPENAIRPCEQNIPMSQRLLRGDRHNLQLLSTMQHLLLASCIKQCYTPYSGDSQEFLQLLQRAPFHHGRHLHRIAARVVDLYRKSTSLEENTRVITNSSTESSTASTSSSARAATKHLMSVKQSHTALQPKSLKSELTSN